MHGERPGPQELCMAAIERLPCAAMVLDAAGRPVLVNEACRRILGQGLDCTRPIHEQADAFAPREATGGAPVPVASLLARALTGDKMGDYELKMRPAGAATDLWLRISGGLLRDVHGETCGVALVISDVTRERHLAQELHDAANENLFLHGTLAERERRLQDLVARWLEPQGGTSVARGGQERNVDDLTPRERDVLALLGAGRTNQEIADELHVAPGTVRLHVKHILSKLGAANRTQAALSVWQLWRGS